MKKKGMTLVEVLLYVAILSGILIVLGTALTISTRVGVQESGSSEVQSQLTLTMQKIERLVRTSSQITTKIGPCVFPPGSTPITNTNFFSVLNPPLPVIPVNQDDNNPELVGYTPYACLILRTASTATDPTMIWAEPASYSETDPLPTISQGVIKIKQGVALPKTLFSSNSIFCKIDYLHPLNHCLNFTKYEQHKGHAVVQIDLALSKLDPQPVTRKLVTSITRASAATFDAGLLPATGNTGLNIGESSNPWQNLFLSGDLTVKGTFDESKGYDGQGSGYKMIGYYSVDGNSPTGSTICSAHGNMVPIGKTVFSPTSYFTLTQLTPVVANEAGMFACRCQFISGTTCEP